MQCNNMSTVLVCTYGYGVQHSAIFRFPLPRQSHSIKWQRDYFVTSQQVEIVVHMPEIVLFVIEAVLDDLHGSIRKRDVPPVLACAGPPDLTHEGGCHPLNTGGRRGPLGSWTGLCGRDARRNNSLPFNPISSPPSDRSPTFSLSDNCTIVCAPSCCNNLLPQLVWHVWQGLGQEAYLVYLGR